MDSGRGNRGARGLRREVGGLAIAISRAEEAAARKLHTGADPFRSKRRGNVDLEVLVEAEGTAGGYTVGTVKKTRGSRLQR